MRKWVLVFVLFGCVSFAAGAVERDSLRVLFWNLENFFDWRSDSLSVSDDAFSSRGERHWTRRRFYAKCNAIAKGILWAAGEEGGLPDIISLAEVENAFVLRRLLQSTALVKLDYRIVHYDSPDPRGIDVALLYRASRVNLIGSKPCHLYEDGKVMATRDILLAHFTDMAGEDLAVLVNHHPSKYGGSSSGPRRRMAVERLKAVKDSLLGEGVERIIAAGDFNDTPDNPLYDFLEMDNLALPLHRQGLGTIKYDGRWELIDLVFTTPACGCPHMKILHIPFLEEPDATHGGTKPLRTYSGPRYRAGVSDHCPVTVVLSVSPGE
ncbi:MAG: hypothetical protein J5835_05360 [Bacteroidales bacterium]|nr:hypothetical protein [Bacteroidales bacterium]